MTHLLSLTEDCAPTRLNNKGKQKDPNTCYSYTSLKELSRFINEDQAIPNKINTNDFSYEHKNHLLKEVRDALKPVCENKHEMCWADRYKDQISIYTSDFTYKPPHSKKPHDWLSNLDIDSAMEQIENYIYEQKNFKLFKYLRCESIDFQVYLEEERLDLVPMVKQGYRRFAMVVNTSKRKKAGQHWICFYFDIFPEKNRIVFYFFNSSGRPPTQEIIDYKKRVFADFKVLGYNDFETKINKIKVQFQNSECGTYCLLFISSLILENYKTKSNYNGLNEFEITISSLVDDQQTNKLRSLFFSPFKGYHFQRRHVPGHCVDEKCD